MTNKSKRISSQMDMLLERDLGLIGALFISGINKAMIGKIGKKKMNEKLYKEMDKKI